VNRDWSSANCRLRYAAWAILPVGFESHFLASQKILRAKFERTATRVAVPRFRPAGRDLGASCNVLAAYLVAAVLRWVVVLEFVQKMCEDKRARLLVFREVRTILIAGSSIRMYLVFAQRPLRDRKQGRGAATGGAAWESR
jgi:hypothetical protein